MNAKYRLADFERGCIRPPRGNASGIAMTERAGHGDLRMAAQKCLAIRTTD
jgi:hypothetical protein